MSFVATSADDILKHYNISVITPAGKTRTGKILNITSSEQEIINYLKREPMDADALSRILGISVAKIGVDLSLMQLKTFS